MNSHYIPRLLLRHFPSKKGIICLYDLPKRLYSSDIKIEKAFAIEDYYPDEIEKEFNLKIELAFAQILNDIILAAKNKKIRLDRRQVQKVKKFLLLLIIRSIHQEAWVESEMRFEDTMKKLHEEHGITDDFIFTFKEKRIEGETLNEYWIRSMKCILDSENGLPEELEKDPNSTQMAWRWAWVIKSGYLGFWSSKGTNVDFLVTDIGMTSESEMAIGADQTWNPAKQISLIMCVGATKDSPLFPKEAKEQFLQTAIRQCFLHENFMEFPISKDLMIVLINPYYKLALQNKHVNLPFATFEKLTRLNNKTAYSPNRVTYVKAGSYQDGDIFEYDIHNLTRENCIYLNMLTLDRVDTTLGFADPKRILSSLEAYQSMPGKLNNYLDLIKWIKGEVVNV